ncbi:succinate-semialdehyde dehydrogenase mitochondrial-like, partial [Trifolium pratense]
MSTDAHNIASQLNSSGLLRTQGLIGGKWQDAYDGKTIKVYNPSTGESIADVACMGGRETNDAISSAFDAFKSWSKTTAAERSKLLRKWYDLLMAHKEELAQLITLEQGKPLKESLGEINYSAGFIEFASEEAKRIYGDIIPAPQSDRRLFVLKQPVGVVGAITPWNFPLAMITRKVGPALACGCTVVIKPSELTPLTALAAAELSIQAGIPAGVVNVVMGNAPDIGDALIASPQVRKITFTGSTAVGKKLMAGSAETVKKVSLELGGNAPCIVFDDADLDVAVKGTDEEIADLQTHAVLVANQPNWKFMSDGISVRVDTEQFVPIRKITGFLRLYMELKLHKENVAQKMVLFLVANQPNWKFMSDGISVRVDTEQFVPIRKITGFLRLYMELKLHKENVAQKMVL